MNTILIIDDNQYIRFTLTVVVEEYGYRAITAESCEEGIKEIMMNKPSLIILDKKLPDGDGIDLLKTIRKLGNIPVIMLTAYANEISSVEAMRHGAFALFTKPFNNDEMISTIKKALP